MLTTVMAILGFAAPFIPEVIKLFTAAGDRKHELAMMKLRMESAAADHTYRMEEVQAQADIEEAKVLHKPIPSYGVKLIDTACDKCWPRWSILPAFYLFVVVDFLSAMVRPGVTYAVIGFYGTYKFARLALMQSVSDESFNWYEGVVNLWSEQDYAVLTLVLSYWFGQRVARQVFGWGSAR